MGLIFDLCLYWRNPGSFALYLITLRHHAAIIQITIPVLFAYMYHQAVISEVFCQDVEDIPFLFQAFYKRV
jgi:hypothetical protein